MSGYFTWKDTELTSDCASLEAMASRFEEAARLMRRMSSEGFRLEKRQGLQQIVHPDQDIFNAWGFISEGTSAQQLTLIPDLDP